MPARDARAYLSTLAPWAIAPLDAATTERAWEVQDAAGLGWWDSLLVAAALRADCRLFVTEDMHDGAVVDGMRIANPFTAAFVRTLRSG
jgi:predicted nucleic acid-binding protein